MQKAVKRIRMAFKAQIAGLVFCAVAVLLLHTTSAQENPPDCTTGIQYYPHATNCSLYWACTGIVAVLKECPPGLWWNPTSNVCDWPADSGCTAGSTTVRPPTETSSIPTETSSVPTEQTSMSTEQTSISTEQSSIPTEQTSISTEQSSISTEQSSIPTEQTSSIPTEQTSGLPTEGTSPSIPTEQTSVLPTEGTTSALPTEPTVSTEPTILPTEPTSSGIPTETTTTVVISTEGSTTEGSTVSTEAPIDPDCPGVDDPDRRVRYPHETRCDRYYLCVAGEKVLYACPGDFLYSYTQEFCFPPELAGCDRCPIADIGYTVRLPVDDDCNLYYVCINLSPVLYQCSYTGEYEFSRTKRYCLSPSQAQCTPTNKL